MAEPLAESKQTCLSPEAWILVKDCFEGKPADPVKFPGFMILGDPSGEVDLPSTPLPSICLRPEHHRYVSRYIPPNISARIRGTAEELTETRVVCVLFANIVLNEKDVQPGETGGTKMAETFQDIFSTLQRCVYRFEGTVGKFMVDDKGVLMLASWGLPPLTHLDDKKRCVMSAIDIVRQIGSVGHVANVGLTFGEVSCTIIGVLNDSHKEYNRCEFTVMGSSVNFAARLMSEAGNYPGRILASSDIYESTKLEIEYEKPDAVLLKGMKGLVPIFPVVDEIKDTENSSNFFEENHEMLSSLSYEFVCCKDAVETSDSLQRLCTSEGGVILVMGEQGCGKHYVVNSAIKILSKNENLKFYTASNAEYVAGSCDLKSDLRLNFQGHVLHPLEPFIGMFTDIICEWATINSETSEASSIVPIAMSMLRRGLERNRSTLDSIFPELSTADRSTNGSNSIPSKTSLEEKILESASMFLSGMFVTRYSGTHLSSATDPEIYTNNELLRNVLMVILEEYMLSSKDQEMTVLDLKLETDTSVMKSWISDHSWSLVHMISAFTKKFKETHPLLRKTLTLMIRSRLDYPPPFSSPNFMDIVGSADLVCRLQPLR